VKSCCCLYGERLGTPIYIRSGPCFIRPLLRSTVCDSILTSTTLWRMTIQESGVPLQTTKPISTTLTQMPNRPLSLQLQLWTITSTKEESLVKDGPWNAALRPHICQHRWAGNSFPKQGRRRQYGRWNLGLQSPPSGWRAGIYEIDYTRREFGNLLDRVYVIWLGSAVFILRC